MYTRLAPLALACLMLLAAPAHALTPPAAAQEKLVATEGDDLFIGMGLFNDQVNANAELVTGWGNFMLRVGRFQDAERGLAANMSWRRPITMDDKRGSGYYMGLFGGQIDGARFKGETIQRLGGGAELGYHWVREFTRAEVTVGLGSALAEKDEASGDELAAAPTIFFSFNIALGY